MWVPRLPLPARWRLYFDLLAALLLLVVFNITEHRQLRYFLYATTRIARRRVFPWFG
jgi:hypothetical protein